MKQGLLVILPVTLIAVFLSRPVVAPAHQVASTPEVEVISIKISPEKVIQGDPMLIEVEGTSTIHSLVFKGESLPVFVGAEGHPAALVGLDLRLAPKTYPLTLTLSDGRVVQRDVAVGAKVIASAPLGIPEELGGNTPAAEQELVSTLVEEGKIISAIKSSREKLWASPFAFPLAPPITITDVYGYSRQTGGSSLAHKGTDFRAAVGTPVMAIGDGVVAYVGYLRNYGHVVAVDHGAKVLSIYMHLSRVDVAAGERVEQGKQVALSGNTGYVLGPHLHLTIRINNISIDPIKFLSLLGT